MKPAGNFGEKDAADVVVIGAGPSGSIASRLISEAGYSVTIIDSKMEIGAPVICADMVNLRAAEDVDIESDQRIALKPVEKIIIQNSGSKSFFYMHAARREEDAFNVVVERDRLDKELASRALLSGARLKIRSELSGIAQYDGGVRVTYRKDGRFEDISAKFAILATGAIPSKVLASSDKHETFNFTYRRCISDGNTDIGLKIGPNFSLNYNITRGNGQINLLDIGRVNPVRSNEHPAEGRDILSGAQTMELPVQHLLGSGNILRAGACAGLYDPFFMTGFREAVISGRLAAYSIIEALRASTIPVESYNKKVEETLLPGIAYGRALRRELQAATEKGIESLVSYLSGFEFREISSAEIFRAASLKEEELGNLLGQDH